MKASNGSGTIAKNPIADRSKEFRTTFIQLLSIRRHRSLGHTEVSPRPQHSSHPCYYQRRGRSLSLCWATPPYPKKFATKRVMLLPMLRRTAQHVQCLATDASKVSHSPLPANSDMFKSLSIIHELAGVHYRVDLYQNLGGFRYVWVCTHCRSCGANPSYFPVADEAIGAAKRSIAMHKCPVPNPLGRTNGSNSLIVVPALEQATLLPNLSLPSNSLLPPASPRPWSS
jgi:hypothetical protein